MPNDDSASSGPGEVTADPDAVTRPEPDPDSPPPWERLAPNTLGDQPPPPDDDDEDPPPDDDDGDPDPPSRPPGG